MPTIATRRDRQKIEAAMQGAGAAALLPFEDNFTRSDGDLANGWEYTAGKWTISSNTALGTPGLGSNVVINGTFDEDTDWTKNAGWSIAAGVASRDGTAGLSDLVQSGILTANQWYQVTWDIVVHNSGGGFSARLSSASSLFVNQVQTHLFTHRATGTGFAFRANAEDGSLDNVIVQPITLADMFATRDFEQSDVDVRAEITCAPNSIMGLVVCLDDKDSPANFLLAYVKRDGLGDKVTLDKYVGGTITNLLDVATVYSTGKVLRVVKNGTSVDVYYDGTQRGTTQTVSDAGIISNTRHGMFSTQGGATSNSLDAFFCDNAS